MTLVNQPTALPTNKLSASILGMVAGAVAFEILATYFPNLREVEIAGVGNLSMVSQIVAASVIGYMVPDRANV